MLSKTAHTAFLDSLDAIETLIDQFKLDTLEGSPIKVTLLDDESIDIRNRLSIIAINGIIGFILILLTLFLFLNKRSGFWVAMGIPFTLCFTLICGYFMGYTVNGTTLAAVIIVLGIVVDDAIIVSENINRKMREGHTSIDAVIKGTHEVFMPVFASIITTCVAFLPLAFFSGRYGKFLLFIPIIVTLMLVASLFESLFILPGHMDKKDKLPTKSHWFDRYETRYGNLLTRLLPKRYLMIGLFIGLLALSGYYVTQPYEICYVSV